jgi:hypothetical protein
VEYIQDIRLEFSWRLLVESNVFSQMMGGGLVVARMRLGTTWFGLWLSTRN